MMQDGEGRKADIDPSAVDAARRASPEAFLRRFYGKDVLAPRSGRSIRVDHVCRADRKPNGTWISCDWHGGGIGDNIALVRRLSGRSFVEAIEELIGVSPLLPPHYVTAEKEEIISRPRLPSPSQVEEGRAYLQERGISDETIRAAESAAALTYIKGAVVFLGRDHSERASPVRLASLRYIAPIMAENGSILSKRDLQGSDKKFPMMIPGEPGLVAVVEGGTNALALRDLYLRQQGFAPFIVATGGAGVRHWVTGTPHTIRMLEDADHIRIWGENERGRDSKPDMVKQTNIDLLRRRLADDISSLRAGDYPSIAFPPREYKDIADWNLDSIPKNDPNRPKYLPCESKCDSFKL